MVTYPVRVVQVHLGPALLLEAVAPLLHAAWSAEVRHLLQDVRDLVQRHLRQPPRHGVGQRAEGGVGDGQPLRTSETHFQSRRKTFGHVTTLSVTVRDRNCETSYYTFGHDTALSSLNATFGHYTAGAHLRSRKAEMKCPVKPLRRRSTAGEFDSPPN
eukprot:3299161-Pyramimonas_sp.AAC.2